MQGSRLALGRHVDKAVAYCAGLRLSSLCHCWVDVQLLVDM